MGIKTETYEVKLKDLEVSKKINQDLLFEYVADYFFPARPPLITLEMCDFMNTHYPVMGYRKSSKIEIIAGLRQLQLMSLNPKMCETKIPVEVVTSRLSNQQIREIAFLDLVMSQVLFSSGKPCDLLGLLVNGCSEPSLSMKPVLPQLKKTETATFFQMTIQTLKYYLTKK